MFTCICANIRRGVTNVQQQVSINHGTSGDIIENSTRAKLLILYLQNY